MSQDSGVLSEADLEVHHGGEEDRGRDPENRGRDSEDKKHGQCREVGGGGQEKEWAAESRGQRDSAPAVTLFPPGQRTRRQACGSPSLTRVGIL